jgi:inositol-1,3,4-trisphosphate 5/6-kinase/inositol-tetrakisphosphate 1-kinase
MSIIFNEAGLVDCKPPCVAQTFINHNAVLFKIYVLGDEFKVVERPSLKNFYPSGDYFTIKR